MAAQTDRDTYPLLQDVNIGWLEKIRTKAPGQVKAAGGTPGKVTVGSTGDFRNLDALVYAAVQMLSPCHRKRPDLVVLIDRDLLHTKSLANAGGATDNINELALTAYSPAVLSVESLTVTRRSSRMRSCWSRPWAIFRSTTRRPH